MSAEEKTPSMNQEEVVRPVSREYYEWVMQHRKEILDMAPLCPFPSPEPNFTAWPNPLYLPYPEHYAVTSGRERLGE